MKNGVSEIDALVSLTGFSLVGGPAYNDAEAAVYKLKTLDVPYIAAHPLEFQTLEQWNQSAQGLRQSKQRCSSPCLSLTGQQLLPFSRDAMGVHTRRPSLRNAKQMAPCVNALND